MNPLPVSLDPRAADDVRAVPPELRPAVFEHLTRIGIDHASCSRPAAFPRLDGREAGLWCRYSDGRAALIEVLFYLLTFPDRIVIRRVLVRPLDRLPGWVVNPSEWPGDKPSPVVDI